MDLVKFWKVLCLFFKGLLQIWSGCSLSLKIHPWVDISIGMIWVVR